MGDNAKKEGPMNFSEALEQIKLGYWLTRAGWNGKGQYLILQEPDAKSLMTLPYIFIRTVSFDAVPWVASQTDLMAEDWLVSDLQPMTEIEPERQATTDENIRKGPTFSEEQEEIADIEGAPV